MRVRSGHGARRTVVVLGGALVVAAVLTACGVSIVGTLDAPGPGGVDGGGGIDGSAPETASDAAAGDVDTPPAQCFALSFDGNNDYVTVNDAADLDPTGSSTVEAWVRLTKDTSPELHVVSHHDHDDNVGYLLMAFGFARNGGMPAQLGGCTRYYDGQQMNQVGFGNGSSMPLNRWVHLAATYDGTAVRIHVDGKTRGSDNILPRHPNADFAGVLHIGRNALGQNFGWGGLIDEVRISRVARYSESDFTPAPRFTVDADTIALWHFDEGTGTTVNDAAGTHPGTISGAKWARTTACDAR